MRLILAIWGLLLGFACFPESAWGQSEPKLLDAQEFVNCEWQRGYIDILLSELSDDPKLKGVIVIYGRNPIFPHQNRFTIRNHIQFRGVDPSKVELLFGGIQEKSRLELWTMPIGANTNVKHREWTYQITKWDQPLLVHAESWTDGIGCGWYVPDRDFYASFLKSNDDFKGRLIVRDRSTTQFNKVRSRLNKELRRLNVAGSRVEFGYIKDSRADVEYWLIPKNYFSD